MNERISFLCGKCRFEGSRQCDHCVKGDLFMENRVRSNMPPAFSSRISYASYSETMRKNLVYPFKIKNVIFNEPATIVFWADGTKTVVKCQEGDVFDPEKGLAMAFMKKVLGNKGHYFEEVKKWVPEEYYEEPVKEKQTVIGNVARVETTPDGVKAYIDLYSSVDSKKLVEAIKNMEVKASMEIVGEDEKPEDPCDSCEREWGVVGVDGQVRQCSDTCEIYEDYIKSLKEGK